MNSSFIESVSQPSCSRNEIFLFIIWVCCKYQQRQEKLLHWTMDWWQEELLVTHLILLAMKNSLTILIQKWITFCFFHFSLKILFLNILVFTIALGFFLFHRSFYKQIFKFVIFNDLEQLGLRTSIIPNCLRYEKNILDLFLNLYVSAYCIELFLSSKLLQS